MSNNIKNGLYHQATGLPWAEVRLPFETATPALCYSHHARQAAISDRYGIPATLPSHLPLNTSEIFEFEVLDGRVTKFAVRLGRAGNTTTGKHFDLVLVCDAPDRFDTCVNVRTLWLNEPGDKHATLNKSNYVPYAK